MAEITIDNLDLEEEDGTLEEQPIDESFLQPEDSDVDSEFLGGTNNDEPSDNSDGSVIDSLLKYYGILDKSKIAFEDEQGFSQKNWDDLSFEEKMNILKTSTNSPERDLDDLEIALINDIRRRNLTPQDYLNLVLQAGALAYSNQLAQVPQYKIDDLTDDDIFILDLQDRVPDISDEDVQEALTKAKENLNLFNRLVEGIRNELKQQELAYLLELQVQYELAQLQLFEQFKNSVGNSLASFDRVGNLDLNLDNDDRDNIMSFILDTDDTGMSTLGKALNDPQMLVKLSWFALYGDLAFNTILSYFANEIKKANISGYLRGLTDGKKGTSKVVYTKPSNQPREAKSIDDLYG